ncbi:hypothetical protein HDV06_001442 [Boothiomyces sp. JEL0866]|nr:hypothetical protein HDV06_001442 [Boothiomyces sp. JEL0866]
MKSRLLKSNFCKRFNSGWIPFKLSEPNDLYILLSSSVIKRAFDDQIKNYPQLLEQNRRISNHLKQYNKPVDPVILKNDVQLKLLRKEYMELLRSLKIIEFQQYSLITLDFKDKADLISGSVHPRRVKPILEIKEELEKRLHKPTWIGKIKDLIY